MRVNRRTMLATTSALLGSSLLPSAAAAEPPAATAKPDDLFPPVAVSLSDFESLARTKIPRASYEYIAGGAADEITLRWNREAFDALRLRPRVLVDVEKIDTSLTLFGQKLGFPILLAPTAFHRLVHPEGEVETARGAALARALFVVSSLSTRRVEEITAASSAPFWFQLFDIRKERRGFVQQLVAAVAACGCRALVVTADAPVTGARNRSERARFHLPDDFETPYYPDRAGRRQVGGLPVSGSSTWDDLAWLRSKTGLPILLKGILNPADAKRAVKLGSDGIIVSNHGGRELDTVPATITVLPEIVQAVGGRVPVLVDGGVRRGTDVLKALALGARAVLIGRPYLYGLAVGGAEGVARVVGILRTEFEMAMALAGRRNLKEIDRGVLY
jgi:4-hydroxymandelate oxidase